MELYWLKKVKGEFGIVALRQVRLTSSSRRGRRGREKYGAVFDERNGWTIHIRPGSSGDVAGGSQTFGPGIGGKALVGIYFFGEDEGAIPIGGRAGCRERRPPALDIGLAKKIDAVELHQETAWNIFKGRTKFPGAKLFDGLVVTV